LGELRSRFSAALTSSDPSQRAFVVFDATNFRNAFIARADASGAGATVEIHLVNGQAHRVRSVVEVTDGYVVLEVYQRRPEMSGTQTHWRGTAPPEATPNEIHLAVITYESIADLLITPAEDKANSRIGFGARG
jgi:hypothetical protein